MCATESVVLFGGANVDGTLLNDTWTFNGTNWTQVSVSNSGSRRAARRTALVGSGDELAGPLPTLVRLQNDLFGASGLVVALVARLCRRESTTGEW